MTRYCFEEGRDYEVECPTGVGLDLAMRPNGPILVDDALLDRAGVCLSASSYESHR